MPIVEKIARKLMMIVAIVTTPKSSGEINRARTIETTMLTTKTEYFSIALQNIPFNKSFFMLVIYHQRRMFFM